MANQVKFDYTNAKATLNDAEIKMMSKIVNDAKEQLVSKTGAGNDFLGWIDLPVNYDKEEFARIKNGETIEKPNYSIVIVDVLLNKIIDRYKMKESIKENVKNGVPLYLDIDPTDELYNRLMKLDLNLEDNYEEKAKFEEDVYFELNKLGFVKEAPTFVRLNYLKDINNIIHFGIILVLMYLLFIGGITAYAIIPIIAYLVFTCKNVKLTKKGTTESLMIMLYNETNNNK